MGCGSGIRKRRESGQERSLEMEHFSSVSAMIVLPRIPNRCPNCGAPLNEKNVKWIGPTTAKCPYCDTGVPVGFDKIW